MTDKVERSLEVEKRNRRDFLKKAGTVAVTTPAVAILLSSEANAGRPNGSGGANENAADHDGSTSSLLIIANENYPGADQADNSSAGSFALIGTSNVFPAKGCCGTP